MISRRCCGSLGRCGTSIVRFMSQSHDPADTPLETHSKIPDMIKRKHVSDAAFVERNRQYLTHPVSRKFTPRTDPHLSQPVSELITHLKQELKQEMQNTSSKLYKTGYKETYPDKHRVFMTQSELSLSRENWYARLAHNLTDFKLKLEDVRDEVERQESMDESLQWLKTADVTFVDCSDGISNQERYITTRQPDGLLYHNPHAERDLINGCFFRRADQLYPSLDLFLEDKEFEMMLGNPTLDVVNLLDLLSLSLEPDNPLLHKRLDQIIHKVFQKEELIGDVIFSCHFIPLLLRLTNKPERAYREMASLFAYLKKNNKQTIMAAVMSIALENDEQVLKAGERAEPSKILLKDSRDIIAMSAPFVKKVPRHRVNAYKVSVLCGILNEDVETATIDPDRPNDLIATLKEPAMAAELHNDGMGALHTYNNVMIKCFPVKSVQKKTVKRKTVHKKTEEQNKFVGTPFETVGKISNKSVEKKTVKKKSREEKKLVGTPFETVGKMSNKSVEKKTVQKKSREENKLVGTPFETFNTKTDDKKPHDKKSGDKKSDDKKSDDMTKWTGTPFEKDS